MGVLQARKTGVRGAALSGDGCHVVTVGDDHTVRIWRRRRPEWWWGVFDLYELWATVFFGALLIWSLWRDRKYFTSLSVKGAVEGP